MRINILNSILIASLLLVGACKPENTPEPGPPASSMTATVNGKSFNAESFMASIGSGFISLAGEENSGTSKVADISFAIPHYAGLATYPIDTANSASYVDNTGTYNAKSGSITISTFNEVHITGTFAFEVVNSVGLPKSVSSGSFDYYR